MSLYELPPDVYVAFEGRYCVWLNVGQDRYFAIERDRTAGFHERVRGWPERSEGPDCTAVTGKSAIAQLLKSGLLVERGTLAEAKGVSEVAAVALAGDICLPSLAPRADIRLHHVCNLARASSMAASTLKWRGLARSIARMKHHQSHPRRASAGADLEALSQLVCVFALLRPFFFASRDRCLLTTFALSEFLSRYGMRTQCVIGVHARPFAAHCWLEHGSLVLNDTVERVRRYAPILRV